MNSYKNHHRKSRFKINGDRNYRKRNGNGSKINADFNGSLEFKRKHLGRANHNPIKLVEKYNDLAREALSNGDKILSENYLQHADHFSRIIIAQETAKQEITTSSNLDLNKKENNENKDKENTLKDENTTSQANIND
tara:strand:- start:312 stop:722 length:411 start_codon:yes stop_codon:yes gene_type:complete